jgi:L-ribulose-5-phosphate 3-epimerase
MKKSISLRAFPAKMPTRQRLQLARDAGFDGVEVNLEPAEDYPLTCSDRDLDELRGSVDEAGLSISAIYSRQQWLHPITSLSEETRRSGERLISDLVRAASRLEVDTVLVIPGAVDNSLFAPEPEVVPYRHAYHRALKSLRVLALAAEQAGVTLAVENVWNKFLLSPIELAQFVDEVGSTHVQVYLDIGNVLRTGYPEDWIDILGSRIRAVQVKDFRRDVDTISGFVGLLQGDVDWPAVRNALARISYDGWITGEVLPAYRHWPETLIDETAHAINTIFSLKDHTPTTQR